MKKIILIFSFIFTLLIGSVAYAKELPGQTNIDNNKAWAVAFTMPMDANYMKDNIYVLDSNNNLVKTILVMNDNKDNIYVIPSIIYKSGETYRLVVDGNIKGTNGIEMGESFYMNFSIK